MNNEKELTVKEAFALAIQNHQNNNLQDARNYYQKVLKIDPNYTPALNNLGVIYKNLQENQKARDCYEKAIEINPNYSDAHNNFGILFKELGEFEKAKECFEKVISIDPNHSQALNNLGTIFQELGELQKVKGCFEKAIEIDPNYVDAHNNLGVIFKDLGQYQKAKECYKKAIEINPNHADAHNNLGVVFKELDDLQKAKECYKKAIEIDPNHANAHLNLGVVFKELGNDQKAKECYEKVIEINPNHIAAYNNLGIIFFELGENQKAKDCYEKVITINPNYINAHNNLGLVYGTIGNQKKAVYHYHKALVNRSDINFEISKEENQELQPATSQFYLELTNKCNFHCEFCPSDSQTRLHGYMEMSLVKKVLDEVSQKKIVTTVNLHLMGEPTLHPKLNEILAYAKSKNLKVSLTTNGSTMVKKRVPKLLDNISGSIVASLMTPTEETYKIRGEVGLSWDRYVDNFRLLIQEHLKKILRGDKIEYEIIFRIMVSNENRKGTAKVLESPKSIQENYDEWSNFTKNTEKELGLIPFNREKINPDKAFAMLGNGSLEVSYLLQKNIKIQFWRAFTFANTRVSDDYKLEPEKKTQFCPHPFQDFGVLWNGDVSLCCLDYDATLKVGNVNDHSVEDVMKSEASNKLRASMHGLEKLHPTCVKCQSRPIET
jgi:radical SAM protein with 4Fe4S-binding SPASM domain